MLRGEPIWQTSSTGPMSMPELERGGGHQGPQVAGPQPGLDPVAAVLGQAAVVGGDHVVAEPLAELVGEALGQAAGVDEHQGGAVLADQLGDAVEHVAHLLGRGDRLELALGQLEGQVEVALVAGVDDGAPSGAAVPHSSRATARSAAGWPTARSVRAGVGRRARAARG